MNSSELKRRTQHTNELVPTHSVSDQLAGSYTNMNLYKPYLETSDNR